MNSGRPSSLATTLRVTEQTERRAALRCLLRQPLLAARDDPDAFTTVVRHERWLGAWFAEQTGWKLRVDRQAGFARLYKVPGRVDSSHAAAAADRPPFDRRRYTLLCLALAALEDGAAQVTLARLAELVMDLSRDDPALEPFDPDIQAERRAFVDALRWLVEHRVLKLRDGDADQYARDRTGDALYDVNDRVLPHLLAAPRPPTLAGSADACLREAYPDSEDGRRQQARHRVTRLLLDEAVLYYEDLRPEEFAWLDHSRGHLYRMLQDDAGFELERRREGLAAVDPEGRVTDERFPDAGSTARHAALLLAAHLAEHGRRNPGSALSRPDVATLAAGLIEDYGARCGWSRQYAPDPAGAAALAEDALAVLERFGLVERAQDGWRPRPAVARFAPESPETPAAVRTKPAAASGGLWT